MIRKLVAVLVLLAAVAFGRAPAWSQGELGSISGVVTDSTGAVVPDADVTAKSTATGAERSVKSGTAGQYTITALEPGVYDLTVKHTGFANFTTRAEVAVGGAVTVDAQLSVSGETISVEVIGEGGVVVNTATQELSQIVTRDQMAALPTLTRNAYDFVGLSGNVSNGDATSNAPTTTANNGGQTLTGRGVGYSVNGQRSTGTEVLLDGVENVAIFAYTVGQALPIDAVQEYSVVTNNFSAEYGRASGGVVNVSSKAGTNSIHGSAWEFNRLSAYTSNTYANNVADVPRGGYVRNQFGFAGGGPLIKNKLFVFESTEWTRVRSGARETEEALDPSFISMLPANSQAFLNRYATGLLPSSGVVTAGQLAAKGLTVGPINGTTPVPASQPIFDIIHFTAPFDAGGDVPQNTYTLLGRVDYNISDKTQVFFRMAMASLDQFRGATFYSPYPQYNVGFSQYDQSYLVSLNHVFSSNLLNSTKISFTRFNDGASYNTALTSTPNIFLNAGSPTDPVTGTLIQLPGLENTAPGNGGLPAAGPQNTFQLGDDVSWTKGKHSIHFGGQYTYMQLNYAYGAYAQAVEQLGAGLQQGMNGLVNSYGNPGGSPLVSFVSRLDPLVLPCAATPAFWATNATSDLIQTPGCSATPPLGLANYARSYRYNDWALYAADSFRVTRRLTLNYGLRYEHYGTQHNNHQDLDSNFYLGQGSGLYEQVASGQVFTTQQSPVGKFWAPVWGTLAPRVGFAFDVFGDGKTSLRGGFGISYERNFGNVTYNASFNPPSSAVLNSVCAPTALATCSVLVSANGGGPLSVPGPPSYVPPVELRMPNPNINVAQTQFWSLDVQRSLARNTMVDVSYSGAHGVHLYDLNAINLLGAGNFYLNQKPENANCNGPVDATTGLPICYTRPNNQYSNINERGSRGGSSYNALNIKFETQNLANTGLTLVANYTWAHSLDDLSSTFSDSLQGASDGIGDLGYLNVLNPKLSWGSSDYDIRNRFAISPLWVVPWFNSGSGWKRQVLGGYTISGIFTTRSGLPFSIYDYSYSLNLYTPNYLVPDTPITQYKTGTARNVGTNLFNVLNVPVPAPTGPLDPALGISDFGPYPADMTHRNQFRAPGAWNTNLALVKNFKLTERFSMNFRAELFNAFNHANLYVNTTNLAYGFSPTLQGPGATMLTGSTQVVALKGGLGSIALGGNHDERRFAQFALQLLF